MFVLASTLTCLNLIDDKMEIYHVSPFMLTSLSRFSQLRSWPHQHLRIRIRRQKNEMELEITIQKNHNKQIEEKEADDDLGDKQF
jgi:hypothetical protein